MRAAPVNFVAVCTACLADMCLERAILVLPAGITALSLLITPFLLQACRHILQEGSSVDSLSALPSVSLPVSLQPLLCYTCCGTSNQISAGLSARCTELAELLCVSSRTTDRAGRQTAVRIPPALKLVMGILEVQSHPRCA